MLPTGARSALHHATSGSDVDQEAGVLETSDAPRPRLGNELQPPRFRIVEQVPAEVLVNALDRHTTTVESLEGLLRRDRREVRIEPQGLRFLVFLRPWAGNRRPQLRP